VLSLSILDAEANIQVKGQVLTKSSMFESTLLYMPYELGEERSEALSWNFTRVQ